MNILNFRYILEFGTNRTTLQPPAFQSKNSVFLVSYVIEVADSESHLNLHSSALV